jgi:hypothetical protein
MTTDAKPAANPANAVTPQRRARIPMSVPQRKLEVTDIPGFHLYWFRDENIDRAIQAGYEFVSDVEVHLNQGNAGTSKDITGNADMGTRVRVVSGTAADGGAEHLTLMKIRQEWWEEDRKLIDSRNADIMSAIFQGEQVLGSDKVSPEDKSQSYVKTALFNRPTRKGK